MDFPQFPISWITSPIHDITKAVPCKSLNLPTATSYANYAGLTPGQQRDWMPPHSPNMVLKAITKSTLFFPNSLDNFGDKVCHHC